MVLEIRLFRLLLLVVTGILRMDLHFHVLVVEKKQVLTKMNLVVFLVVGENVELPDGLLLAQYDAIFPED